MQDSISINKKRVSIILAAISISCALALADEADNTESMKTQKLEKVVATAKTMKTELDELNRNTYTIDKEAIQDKGYSSTEEVFRYTPFVGLSNIGLGSNVDLRGQGNRANTSVQVLINGIYSNMLDSSHGVTPLNTLSPAAIESIEILPGGGAVMYGNGTRGGVININTQKRYETPYFNAGVSYSNFIASVGNSYNADAKFGTKFGDNLYVSLGAAYIDRGGPRQGDRTNGGEVNASILYDINAAHSVSFDIDYFYGIIRTTPNNSFMDIPNPSKNDRKTAGNGSLYNSQQRLDVSFGYDMKISENQNLSTKIFYHLNRINYEDSITRLSTFGYGGEAFSNTSADQSGSLFDDQKIGFTAKYDYKHDKGKLYVGFESIWNQGKRTMNQLINGQTTTNGKYYTDAQGQTAHNGATIYNHNIVIPFVGSKWTNSIYGLEKYDFTKDFSLTGGIRYELAAYSADVTYNTKGGLYTNSGNPLYACFPANSNNKTCINMESTISSSNGATGSLNDTLNNFALELTPNYKYSDTGNVYAKYERGYFSPSPNSLLRRQSKTYLPTNLKKETYDTFEIGLKDYFLDSISFSAAAFYTLTSNEFYTIGNAHSIGGVQYGNYDFTQRAGVEIFSEQSFFNDSLVFSESFTYVDARILKNNGASVSNQFIPYTSNYKATINANYTLLKHFSVWLQNGFYGAQKDIVQKDIKGYILTDLGVSVSIKGLSVNAGIRNLFDTFYYSYYNSDASDTIAGYGFLIGGGRSIFIEGRYTF